MSKSNFEFSYSSLFFGIVGFFLSFIFIGLFFSIASILLSIISISKNKRTNKKIIAGLFLSSISFIIAISMTFIGIKTGYIVF